jgi:hypothetical protein
MKDKLTPFHETLCNALEAGIKYLKDQGAEFNEETMRERYQYDGINYGQYKDADVEIDLMKGKKTKKWAHLTIWRRESGTYEVNAYIL